MDNEEKIPPFVQDYLNKMEYEGYPDFVKLTREYHKEREDYPGKFALQSKHLNDHNRTTGQNKSLNYQDGLDRIDTDFKKKAYQTAKQHGYTGPDPNQPSDKDFTKQGEKFNNMIDQARQRQQQQKRESEQKQEEVKAPEKKNIEALKQQQPYQQNQPKVEFKGIEQEQSAGREQQRAAFLEEIKATRDQQTQRQQDQQPEI